MSTERGASGRAEESDAAPPDAVLLTGGGLTALKVSRIAEGACIELDPAALEAVARNRRVFEELVAEGPVIYGVTTGLGGFIHSELDLAATAEIQRRFLRSHAAGVGEALPPPVVRAALGIRLNCLLQARSGIRPVVLERLAELLNRGIVPYVPSRGSLGASGDLAPAAHASLPLIGEGEVLDGANGRRPAAETLAAAGLEPLALAARESVALINGTHFMAGIGALVQLRTERLLDSADATAALALEALRGHPGPFDSRVTALRQLDGQGRSASLVRAFVNGSKRVGSNDASVQDAYSVRCAPQVHGAAREALGFFSRLVAADLNAALDNPVTFHESREIVSTGNFHGQALGLAFDTLRIALADLASISERRIFRLLSPSLNAGLPPFLSRSDGNHGYMVAQYTAAALLAELRVLAHPVSIDNVPTSDNQEDHVSMGMTAALLAEQSCRMTETVIAIEALCAAQGLETGSEPPGRWSGRLHALIREHVLALEEDRPPAADIELVRRLVANGGVAELARQAAGERSAETVDVDGGENGRSRS